MNIYLTSEEWLELHNKSGILTCILDPDGWDRAKFDYSFYEERISLEEYLARRSKSTCSIKYNG